jgi:hypothetical protein
MEHRRHRGATASQLTGQTRLVATEHERCDACGFDGGTFGDADLLEALRGLGDRWRHELGAAGASLRTRPAPGTWSAIEYAAHSRDITELHVYGVEQALTGGEPVYPPIDADRLIEDAATGYGDADPDEVCDSLDGAARRLGDLAETAGVDTWDRGITVGATRSDVRRLLEHALHDSVHHLDDVARGLAILDQ